MPGYRDARIYPLDRPDLRKARALASGRKRSGTGRPLHPVLPGGPGAGADPPTGTSPKSASRSRSRSSRSKCCSTSCRRRASRSTSAASAGAGCSTGFLDDLFNGRHIGQPGSSNWSYFNSAKYNRLLDRAAEPAGRPARAPMPSASSTCRSLGTPRPPSRTECPTSSRSSPEGWGAWLSNPDLDLTAVCLK